MDFPFPPGAAGPLGPMAATRGPDPSSGMPSSGTPAALAPFLNPVTGRIDVAALSAAYLDMLDRLDGAVVVPGPDDDEAAHIRFRQALGIPDRPDDYPVRVDHPRLGIDPDVNARLHAAGFTPAQAQLVYDLAVERVMPVLEQMGESQRVETDLAKLVEHFGGEDRWGEISRQLAAWGKAHLPEDVYAALASTREGVLALWRMMADGEPDLVTPNGGGGGGNGAPGEDDLKALMRDPRYWKHRDPAVVRRVAEGFRRLYPGGA